MLKKLCSVTTKVSAQSLLKKTLKVGCCSGFLVNGRAVCVCVHVHVCVCVCVCVHIHVHVHVHVH